MVADLFIASNGGHGTLREYLNIDLFTVELSDKQSSQVSLSHLRSLKFGIGRRSTA